MNDLFDTVDAGSTPPAPGPAAPAIAAEQTNQVLVEEEAVAEPEELPGTENGTDEENSGDGEEETAEEANGDTPAASATSATTANQPASKPVNVVEEDVYEFDKCVRHEVV